MLSKWLRRKESVDATPDIGFVSQPVTQPVWGPLRPAEEGEAAHTPKEGPARAYKSWRPEEDDALREGHRNRVPVAELAASLDRSRGAIVSRLHLLMDFDCPPTPDDYASTNSGDHWTPGDDEALIARWRHGADTATLAQHFGRTQKAVQIRLLVLHEVSLPD